MTINVDEAELAKYLIIDPYSELSQAVVSWAKSEVGNQQDYPSFIIFGDNIIPWIFITHD